jgi:MFS family permease
MGAPRGLLLQRNFSALWWGQLISILGERFTYLALVGLLAEHTDHFRDAGSSWLLSVLANVMLAPVLILAPFTGAWVDRWNLRRVLIVSDTLRAAVVLSLPWIYGMFHGVAPMFALVFVLFTCNVFFLPAKSAITPEIVPPSQLLAANALLSVAGIVSTAVGALVGGWVIDHWGWQLALEINAGTYLVSVVALAIIQYHPAAHADAGPRGETHGYLREVMAGWKVLMSNGKVGLGLTALAAVWMGGGFLHVAGNQHIQRAASVPGMERLGLLMCALGLGAGASTWWVNGHGRSLPRPLLLGVGLLCAAGGLVAFAVSTRFAVFVMSAFVIGVFVAPAFVLSETLLQEGAEPRQRGRVFSARDFLMRLLFLLTVTLAAWLTRSFGTRAALLTSSCIVAAAGLLAMAWGVLDPPLMRRESLEPASGRGRPEIDPEAVE